MSRSGGRVFVRATARGDAPGRADREPQIGDLAATGRKELLDTAYFAPTLPSQQIGGDASAAAFGPNALSLRSPHGAAGPQACLDVDRGGLSLNEDTHRTPTDVAFGGTRNLGGSALGASVDGPVGRFDRFAKVAFSAASNGQGLALTPSVAYHNLVKDEVAAGASIFGTAHSDLRVLPGDDQGRVAVQSRQAFGKGFAVDPRLTWAPAWTGVFVKVVRTRVEETLYHLVISPRRAGALLQKQQADGLMAPLQTWMRQWMRAVLRRPTIRQPALHDPLGDEGGRVLQPGQVLSQQRSETRVAGVGAGIMGVRAGHYELKSEEMQIVVRCIDEDRVTLTISPRTCKSSSLNVDSPLGPNLQAVDTEASGALRERVFNLKDGQQKAIFERLVRGEDAGAEAAAATPVPHLCEKATLVGRDESKGVTRIPFRTSWGGLGEQISRCETNVTRDEHGRLSQSRRLVSQTTQHALEQGKNTWHLSASSHASSLPPPFPPQSLAFRGLSVSAERSASRPDRAMRNVMTAEQARLWHIELPPILDGPRNDYKIVATALFSGKQLAALEKELPQHATLAARACGAAPEPLLELLEELRATRPQGPWQASFSLAWRRSILVSNYLQTAGAVGLAALHRLLGGTIDLRSDSEAYHAPLQSLTELTYMPRPQRKKAQQIAAQLRGALRAARADVVMLTCHPQDWQRLVHDLERGIAEAERIGGA